MTEKDNLWNSVQKELNLSDAEVRTAQKLGISPQKFKKLANSNQQKSKSTSIEIRQLIGILGAIILFLGVFAPIISVPLRGTINYFQNGKGDGTIIAILAAISLSLTLRKSYRGLWLTSLCSQALMIFSYISFHSWMTETKSQINKELQGTIFEGLEDIAVQSAQIEWGWAVMIVGAILLQITAMMREQIDDEKEGSVTQHVTGAQKEPTEKASDWVKRGIGFYQSGKYDEAILAFTSAIALSSNHVLAYYNRGVVYSKIGKREQAINDLKVAARLGHPKSQEILKSKGVAWTE